MSRETVCVAMSGGVDSAVAAALLARDGNDVVGVTMQIWQESATDPRHAGCCSLGAVEDARRCAAAIGIPHYTLNFQEKFKETVIDEFVEQYAAGRTPNPCVTCNRKVKFDALLNKSKELGCDRLATGHYARVERDQTGTYRLKRALDLNKDQSYALYSLTQEQMTSLMLPLGALSSKTRTRELAAQFGLPVADKPDSQEICFVTEAGGYRSFVEREMKSAARPGALVANGRTLGAHEGVHRFTIGQRRGLGVTAPDARPLYVVEIREDGTVVLGDRDELARQTVELTDPHWPGGFEHGEHKVMAKIRYNMAPQRATLGDGGQRLEFDQPVYAVASGQTAVAYRGEELLAGGTIK